MIDVLLNQLRKEGDPPADAIVTLLATKHNPAEMVDLLQKMVRLGPGDIATLPIDAALKPQFLTYIDQASKLPPWASQPLMHRGASHFRDHNMLAFLILGCASLPSCYAWRNEASVLGLTLQLTRHVHRRIPETAQFVHDVMTRDGLNYNGGATGVGVHAARKVRLMHAFMRHLIKSPPLPLPGPNGPPTLGDVLAGTKWDVIEQGEPLSQEFLVGTLSTFSCLVLREMKRHGLRVNTATIDAVIHTWNVVGLLLGVREDVLRNHLATYVDCELMLSAVRRRNRARTEQGIGLTTALIGYFQKNLPTKLLDFGPPILSRHLVGREISRLLDLRYKIWHLPLVPFVVLFLHGFARLLNLGWTHRIGRWFFGWLANRIWGWRGRALGALPDVLPNPLK